MQGALAPRTFVHHGHSAAEPLRNKKGVPFPSRPFGFVATADTQTPAPRHDPTNETRFQTPRQEQKQSDRQEQKQPDRLEQKQPDRQQPSNVKAGWGAAQFNSFAQPQRTKHFNRHKGFGGRAAAPFTTKFAFGGFENTKEDEGQEARSEFGTETVSSMSRQDLNQSFQSSNQDMVLPGGPPSFPKISGWNADQSSVSTYQSPRKNNRRPGYVVKPVPSTLRSKIGGFEKSEVEQTKSWAEFMGEKKPDCIHELFSNSIEIELAMQYEKEEAMLKEAPIVVEAVEPPAQQLLEQKSEENLGDTIYEYVPEKDDSRDSVWRGLKDQKQKLEKGSQSDLFKSISSDESEFSDLEEEMWTEAKPMGTGWRLGIFLDVYTKIEEGAQVEIWVPGEGMLRMKVPLEAVEKVKGAHYLRFLPPANPDDFVKMTASKHYASRASMIKVRPGKSLEVRTTAVVAYSKFCDIRRVPVWCDPIGWLDLDCSRFGVLRKGTEKDASWNWFRPLKIVEMTVKVRLDVPFETLDYVRDGISITDVVRILHVDKKENELPNKLYPLVPRRYHDLRLLEPEVDCPNMVSFKSRAYPDYTIFAERDQFAYEDAMEMRHLDMTGILIPVNQSKGIYRALIVGPSQVLQVQTKDRIFDYKRAPVRRHYMPKDEALIERIKKNGLHIDEKFKHMELEDKFDRLPM